MIWSCATFGSTERRPLHVADLKPFNWAKVSDVIRALSHLRRITLRFWGKEAAKTFVRWMRGARVIESWDYHSRDVLRVEWYENIDEDEEPVSASWGDTVKMLCSDREVGLGKEHENDTQ